MSGSSWGAVGTRDILSITPSAGGAVVKLALESSDGTALLPASDIVLKASGENYRDVIRALARLNSLEREAVTRGFLEANGGVDVLSAGKRKAIGALIRAETPGHRTFTLEVPVFDSFLSGPIPSPAVRLEVTAPSIAVAVAATRTMTSPDRLNRVAAGLTRIAHDEALDSTPKAA